MRKAFFYNRYPAIDKNTNIYYPLKGQVNLFYKPLNRWFNNWDRKFVIEKLDNNAFYSCINDNQLIYLPSQTDSKIDIYLGYWAYIPEAILKSRVAKEELENKATEFLNKYFNISDFFKETDFFEEEDVIKKELVSGIYLVLKKSTIINYRTLTKKQREEKISTSEKIEMLSKMDNPEDSIIYKDATNKMDKKRVDEIYL